MDTILDFIQDRNDTLPVMAAASDAGGLQVLTADEGMVDATTDGGGIRNGVQDPFGDAFMTGPDANGVQHPFAIGWIGYKDVAGGILVRTAAFNHGRVAPLMESTEVYGPMYRTLFSVAID